MFSFLGHRDKLKLNGQQSTLLDFVDSGNEQLAVFITDGERMLYVNQAFAQIFGYARELLVEKISVRELVSQGAWPMVQERIQRRLRGAQGNPPQSFSFDALKADGTVIHVEVYGVETEFEAERPVIVGALVDRTLEHRLRLLHNWQSTILSGYLQHADLYSTMSLANRAIENVLPGAIGSILRIKDGKLHQLGENRLPKQYNQAIDGLTIGPNVGSCGTAAYLRKPVFVDDIATDPRWKDYRELAEQFGLRACWSHPIVVEDETKATFAVYFGQPRTPKPDELEIFERLTHLIRLLLVHDETRCHLSQVNERMQMAEQIGRMTHAVYSPHTRRLEWSSETASFNGLGEIESIDQLLACLEEADRERFHSALTTVIRDGFPEEKLLKMRFRDKVKWIRAHLSREPGGTLFIVFRDETEQTANAMALEAKIDKIQSAAAKQAASLWSIRRDLAHLLDWMLQTMEEIGQRISGAGEDEQSLVPVWEKIAQRVEQWRALMLIHLADKHMANIDIQQFIQTARDKRITRAQAEQCVDLSVAENIKCVVWADAKLLERGFHELFDWGLDVSLRNHGKICIEFSILQRSDTKATCALKFFGDFDLMQARSSSNWKSCFEIFQRIVEHHGGQAWLQNDRTDRFEVRFQLLLAKDTSQST